MFKKLFHKLFGKEESFIWKKKVVLITSGELPEDGEIERYIASSGPYDVVVARTGREGIKLTRRINPDIIFVDWDVDNPGGSEVIYQIRRLKRTRTIPLCLLMQGNRMLDYELTKTAGIKDCIMKPFAAEKVVELIRLRTAQS